MFHGDGIAEFRGGGIGPGIIGSLDELIGCEWYHEALRAGIDWVDLEAVEHELVDIVVFNSEVES